MFSNRPVVAGRVGFFLYDRAVINANKSGYSPFLLDEGLMQGRPELLRMREVSLLARFLSDPAHPDLHHLKVRDLSIFYRTLDDFFKLIDYEYELNQHANQLFLYFNTPRRNVKLKDAFELALDFLPTPPLTFCLFSVRNTISMNPVFSPNTHQP